MAMIHLFPEVKFAYKNSTLTEIKCKFSVNAEETLSQFKSNSLSFIMFGLRFLVPFSKGEFIL